MTHMGESKNTFKKIGPSLLLSRNIQRNTNQYDNNNQHIEYNHFIETAHFLQSCIEGIFGLTHIFKTGGESQWKTKQSSKVVRKGNPREQ
jgi:hypothetical protein